jgi:putative hydrolase of the HAD superfamily
VNREPRVRLRCRAVFLDAGGVIVLPHRVLVRDALARVDIDIEDSNVARAHYRAVRQLERDPDVNGTGGGYLGALCRALGVPEERLPDAVGALSHLADRSRSGQILWSEPAPHAREIMAALGRAGIAVLIVTNSDGHAAQNLRDAAICHTTAGEGVIVTAVVDSARVGSAKPDTGIFRIAMQRAHADPASVVHVGDTLSTDVAGAQAAGIIPIHLDPDRCCRAHDHRHIRSLKGIWQHVASTKRVGSRA